MDSALGEKDRSMVGLRGCEKKENEKAREQVMDDNTGGSMERDELTVVERGESESGSERVV